MGKFRAYKRDKKKSIPTAVGYEKFEEIAMQVAMKKLTLLELNSKQLAIWTFVKYEKVR